MGMKGFIKWLFSLIMVCLCMSGYLGKEIAQGASVISRNNNLQYKVSGSDISFTEFEEILNTYSIDDSIVKYDTYMSSYDLAFPEKEIVIAGTEYVRYEESGIKSQPAIYENYKGIDGGSVLTGEDSLIEYKVEVEESGFYNLSLLYYPVEGKSSDIQRSFFIDGKLPYKEFALIEFRRIWTTNIYDTYIDSNGVEVIKWEKDNQGNDLKPSSMETPNWVEHYCYDNNGYVMNPLYIYLTKGTHIISIVSLREPMVINKLILKNMDQVDNYDLVKDKWDKDGASETKGVIVRIEGENTSITSSQMLYPQQDQSSPAVYPSSAKELLNNTIGGNSWRNIGQWVEWDFEVPESGYYNISMFAKQSYLRGINVSRKIMIDGKVPFDEMYDYQFPYDSSWQDITLSYENGSAYSFYLEKGHHTMRMEVVLGEFSNIIGEVSDAVTKLQSIYRKVIRITGVTPDKYRDYQIEAMLPGLEEELIDVRDQLDNAIKQLRAITGSATDKETVLRTMRDQLNLLIKDQEDFIKVVYTFRINVRACGNWIAQVMQQPLAIDRIIVHSSDVTADYEHNSFWSKLVFEIKRLYYSFIIDYNRIGNVADDESDSVTLTLWIGTGRDQANIIKSLIDDTFTSEKNINVNVQLVDMGTLLRAELAGEGPDVAIQVGPSQQASSLVDANLISAANDTPVNYGIRNAVLDLTTFEDYEEVVKRFSKSAMTPFGFRDSVYALPDTQSFLMMFYRKDILSEIGLKVPKTWDDVKVSMTVLAKNQMDFGMYPGEQIFAMLLYQMGGDYYNAEGTASALDSEIAINAFKEYCKFYSDYKLDKETSVEERFRSGDSPIMIADYTVYNNLKISAPDIEGMWGFTVVPGIEQVDGTIAHTTGAVGNANMIMASTQYPDESWEFLKWWTSAETQILYGREMEGLMGSSARVPTANLEALSHYAWPVKEYDALMTQIDQTKGIRQIPGGYYSWRNVNNAFYTVTTDTDTATPREELMDKVIYINAEIDHKLEELGLSKLNQKDK